MNRLETVSVFVVTLFVATACQTEKASVNVSQLLDNCPVVGEYVQVGDDKVLSCDQKLLTDTIHLPLSFFTEEMEIIKLDNRNEALVGQSEVIISDNYILEQGRSPNPYKLFDRRRFHRPQPTQTILYDFLADEELPLLSFDGSFPPFPNFRNSYYIRNIDPGNLRDILDKRLKSGKLSPERQQKLTELKASIHENDNNYILLAKLK